MWREGKDRARTGQQSGRFVYLRLSSEQKKELVASDP